MRATRDCKMVSLTCFITAVVVSMLNMEGSVLRVSLINEANTRKEPLNTSNITEIVRNKLRNTRLLCWVPTTSKYLKTKTRYVRDTWGKRCDIILFFGSKGDKNFPLIPLKTPDGYGNLARKTSAALQYIYEHYRDKADWFLKADDDTYVIVDNLKYFLSDFDTSRGLYFGYTYIHYKPEYNSGGAGYVLSQEALRRFYVHGIKDNTCPVPTYGEDVYIGKCMYHLGVQNVRSLDGKNRTTFHQRSPLTHIDASNVNLRSHTPYGYKTGAQNISTLPFTFHKLSGDDIRLMEFLIYHVHHVSNEGTVMS